MNHGRTRRPVLMAAGRYPAYSDFTQATRSQTVSGAVSDVDQMLEIAETLLASVFPFKRPVRLLGVTLSSLNIEESGQEPQLDLGL